MIMEAEKSRNLLTCGQGGAPRMHGVIQSESEGLRTRGARGVGPVQAQSLENWEGCGNRVNRY